MFLLHNSKESDFYRRFLMLHEMGHILGLDDLYYEKGVFDNAPKDQRTSIMRCDEIDLVHAGSDDAEGIKVVWDYIRGRLSSSKLSCGKGWFEVKPDLWKKTGILYCREGMLVCNKVKLENCVLETKPNATSCLKQKSICWDSPNSGTALPKGVVTPIVDCLTECLENKGGKACIEKCDP